MFEIHERVKPLGILRFYVYTTGPKLPLQTNVSQDISDEQISSAPEHTESVTEAQIQTNQNTKLAEKSELIEILSSYQNEGTTYLILNATDSDAEPTQRRNDESYTSLSDTLPLEVTNDFAHAEDQNWVIEDTSSLNAP